MSTMENEDKVTNAGEVNNEQRPRVEEAVAVVAEAEAVVSESAEPEAMQPIHESAPPPASVEKEASLKMVEPPMPEPTPSAVTAVPAATSDAMIKQRARRTSRMTTTPGVVHEATTPGVVQVAHEPAAAPSAAAASAAPVGVQAAVSQERSDAMAKQRARRTSRMTAVAGATPGAVQVQSEPSIPLVDHSHTSFVATTPGVVHEPSAPGVVQVTHEPAAAPSTATASAASVGVQAAVSQERSDAMAKQRARRTSRMTVVADATPGAVQVQSEPSVPLVDHIQKVVPQQERDGTPGGADVVTASQGRNNVNANAAAALSQVEQDAASKARAARPTRRQQQMAASTTTSTSHSQAEQDAVAKSRGRRRMPTAEAGGPPVVPGVEHMAPPVELSSVDAPNNEDEGAGLHTLARRRDERAAALVDRRKGHASTVAASTAVVGAVAVSTSEPTPETRKAAVAAPPTSTGRDSEPARVFSNMGEEERQRRYHDKMAQMDQQHEDSVEKRGGGGSISNNPANADNDVEGQHGRQRNYLETGAKSQEFIDEDRTVSSSMTSQMPPAITTTADRGVAIAPDVEYGEYTVQDDELAVAIAIDDDEEEQEKKLYAYAVEFDPDTKPPLYQNRRFRLYGIGGALCFVILAIVLVVGIVSNGNKTVQTIFLALPPTEAPTVAPTTSRESGFRQYFAQEVSPLVNMQGTPHYRAAEWIMNEDPQQLQRDSQRLLQRYMMAFLYYHTSTQGEWLSCNPPKEGEDDTCTFLEFTREADDSISYTPKADKTRWLSAKGECYWEGVQCAGGAEVLGFELFGQNLTGTLPTELAALPFLQKISMPYNLLTGTLPSEFADLTHLIDIELHGNMLTGTIPVEFYDSDESSLSNFNIGDNLFSGSVETGIGSMTDLKGLHIFENNLGGKFPSEIGNLQYLSYSRVNGNQFTGPLPTELGSLASLTELWYHENVFTGTIPSHLGGMFRLNDMRLWGNKLTGSIPDELFNLTKLSRFSVREMALTGTLSTLVGQLTDLKQLKVSTNRLTGAIPSEIQKMRSLRLAWLHINQFEGQVPDNICSNVRPGGLNFLQADCHPVDNPPNPCRCCSACCTRETEVCLLTEI